MGDIIHLDFETFSEIDLNELGAFRYASHPSCQILMAAVALNDEEPVIWVHPDHRSSLVKSSKKARALMEMWEDPDVLVYAHNSSFEMAVSRYRMELDIGIEPPRLEQWRCTQTMARRAAIPASLEKCAEYLRLKHQKDKGGSKLIGKFCKIQKPTKNQPLTRITGKDDPAAFLAFTEYCLQDVRTEQEIHKKLKPFEFQGALLKAFQFDARMNMLGVPVNRKALLNTQPIIEECIGDLYKRFAELTGLKPSQNVKVAQWFKARGYKHKGMGQDLVQIALEDLSWAKDADTREAIQIRAEVGFSAVFKVSKMLLCDCGDGWVRGCFMLYGAGPGRWSAKLIQPQNFKKPEPHLKKHTPAAIKDLEQGISREGVQVLYGNPLAVISSSIRHFMAWAKGKLLQADYSSIEARIVCWLAGQEDALQRVRDYDAKKPGAVEPYVHMASVIYGMTIHELIAKGKDCIERFVGKQAVLGCGYQMSSPKFRATCLKYGVDLDEGVEDLAVTGYRKTYNKVTRLWKDCERAARNAILNPGKRFTAGPKLAFTVVPFCNRQFLVMSLPSGRNIVYPEPMIEPGGKFGDQVTYYGQVPKKTVWGRVSIYGAMFVENATQGTAFDIMANGSIEAEKDGFKIFALIHDEALALETKGKTIEGFVAALTRLPKWAEGLPIVAEGNVIPYYSK